MKKFLLGLITLMSSFSLAAINYHGRVIQQSNNLPVASSNARFNFKIKSGTCVVYEENHDGVNMSGSNGYFSLNIGNGSPVFGSFSNAMKVDGSSVNCQAGGSVALTTSSAKSVAIEILDYDGSSYSTSLATISGLAFQEVPLANASKTLEGKPASSFIQATGSVSQNSLESLADGSSSLYVSPSSLSSAVGSATTGKMDKSANLSDVASVATARTNLGLGSLATQSSVPVAQVTGLGSLATLSSVGNSQISDVAYSKITGLPSSFAPSAHSHAISDITNLQSSLDSKVSSSKLSLNCLPSQTVEYVSVSDSYQCQSISISSSQVSGLGSLATQSSVSAGQVTGLGSLATQSSVSDAQITDVSGSKITGAVQLNTVSGTTCSSGGLLRYNAGSVEICDGTNWGSLASNGSTVIIAAAQGDPATTALNSPIIFPTKYADSPSNFYNASTGQFTIPASGYYIFSMNTTYSSTAALTVYLYVNNTADMTLGAISTSSIGHQFGGARFFNAGDVVDFRPNDNLNITNGSVNMFKLQVGGGGGSSIITSADIINALGYTPLSASNNLSDLVNVATARSNLGLGSLATKSSVDLSTADVSGVLPQAKVSGLGSLASLSSVADANITSLAYSKLTGVPTTFTPSTHSHIVDDIGGLQETLDGKVSYLKLNLSCTANQTVQFNSVTGIYSCQSIIVGDSNISSLEGSKLTGGVQVGTVSGTTCTTAGLTRYNSSNLEFCDGANWKTVSSFSNSSTPIISDWVSYTPTTGNLGSGGLSVNFGKWRRNGDSIEIIIYQVKDGVSGSGSSAVTWSLPSGISVDTTKLPNGNSGPYQVVGTLLVANSGLLQSVTYLTGNNSVYSYNSGGQWNGSSYQANGNITLQFSLPVQGWSASTSQVAVYTPPVIAQASGTPTASAGSPLIANSLSFDSNPGAYSTTTGRYTAPSAGYYEIYGSLRTSSVGTIYLYKNGVQLQELVAINASNLTASFIGSIQVNAGDILDIRPNNTMGMNFMNITFKQVH